SPAEVWRKANLAVGTQPDLERALLELLGEPNDTKDKPLSKRTMNALASYQKRFEGARKLLMLCCKRLNEMSAAGQASFEFIDLLKNADHVGNSARAIHRAI